MHIETRPADRRRVTAKPWLNVRSEPEPTASPVGRLDYGTFVLVLDMAEADWASIGFEGAIAYVNERYLSKFWADFWPSESRVVTQYFGAHPERYSKYKLPGHDGIDIAGRYGGTICAIQAGEIYRLERDPLAHNYGLHVRVAHTDNYKSIYCHLSEIADGVAVGRVIESGYRLGGMGNSGNVRPRPSEDNPKAGTHLHLSMKHPRSSWPYNLIDPWPYISPVKERNCHA